MLTGSVCLKARGRGVGVGVGGCVGGWVGGCVGVWVGGCVGVGEGGSKQGVGSKPMTEVASIRCCFRLRLTYYRVKGPTHREYRRKLSST